MRWREERRSVALDDAGVRRLQPQQGRNCRREDGREERRREKESERIREIGQGERNSDDARGNKMGREEGKPSKAGERVGGQQRENRKMQASKGPAREGVGSRW